MVTLARCLIAFFFVASGAGKIFAFRQSSTILASIGFPIPTFFLTAIIAVEIAGGVAVRNGREQRLVEPGRHPACRNRSNLARSDDGRCVPQVRDQQRDVLQMEGQARRAQCVGREVSEVVGRREPKVKKLLPETVLDNAILKEIAVNLDRR